MATMTSRHVFLLALAIGLCAAQYSPAPSGRPSNMPEISNLEVMCGKDHMTVQLGFAAPFQGLVFSKGQFNSPNCVYVKPYTGLGAYTFDIYYNKCGTKPDLNGKFYENTIIVQYDNELIEVWDEAKRLRCEWYNDYEKTATKPPVVIADLEVIELNFRGDNVDCWMEIQDGKGPWASPVTGIVPLGSTLTMVVAINDPNAEFDMRVKECEASDGKGRPIYLSDESGCVLRPKMISKFQKLRSNDGRSTVITYAHFHAFKFPDSMYVHLKCKVEICRYGCPDHCQKAVAGGYAAPVAAQYAAPVAAQYASPEARGYDDVGGLPAASQYDPVVSNALDESTPEVEEKAPVVVHAELAEEYPSAQSAPAEEYPSAQSAPAEEYPSAQSAPAAEYQSAQSAPAAEYQSAPAPVAEQLQQSGPAPADTESYEAPRGGPVVALPQPAARPGPKFRGAPRRRRPQQQRRRNGGRRPLNKRVDMVRPSGGGHSIRGIPLRLPPRGGVNRNNMPDDLPALPDHLQPVLFAPSTRDVVGKPEAIPVPFETDGRHAASAAAADGEHTSDAGLGGVDRSEFPWGPRQLKIRRRRYVVDEPEAKAADIGVGSTLEVISENDLQFEPTYEDNQRVTIFQGQIRDDIVYGICLPAAGFSALFVLLAMCTVISVLVAGFLCHHRQVQKDTSRQPAALPLRDWNMVHFLRQRFHPAQ